MAVIALLLLHLPAFDLKAVEEKMADSGSEISVKAFLHSELTLPLAYPRKT